MAKQFLGRLVCLIAVLCVGRAVALAQTPAGDLLKGQGAYLKGLGSYNLNTAKAGSINVDSMIRWKSDLRKIQRERWDLEAQKVAGKKLRIEEVRQQQLERERQLRLDPSSVDVEKGDALNVLVYDLTDPDIKLSDWSSKTVPLPEGLSVKDLIFRFTPQSKQGAGATALSKGVIALSRLDIKGKWPTFLEIPALAAEKSAYENAYVKVRDEILAEKFNLKSLLEMDRTLDALKSKVKEAVPAERDYRAQALKFVDDLKDSTRMFDAGTVDYAKDILTDTKNGDATTVAELVSFMLKYRLQFATAERSATARELYPKLYEALRQQANELGIKPPEVPVIEKGPSFFNGKDLTGWRGLPAVWAIRDGTLVGTNNPGVLKFNTFLVSDEEFGDFELRCKVKLSVNPPANSGIQFRSKLFDQGAYRVQGPQCDFGEGVAWGSLYNEGPGGGMIQEANKTVVAKALKNGEFNEIFLRCVGQRVTIKLNGQITVDKEFPGIPKRGVVAWQLHKRVGDVVIKDVEFKELPSK